MKNKKVLFFFALILSLVVLSGCGSKGSVVPADSEQRKSGGETVPPQDVSYQEEQQPTSQTNDSMANEDGDQDQEVKQVEQKPDPTPPTVAMSGSPFMDISAQEAKMFMDEDKTLTVIDVSNDYESGHLPKAVNYKLDGDNNLNSYFDKLDKGTTYLVYSRDDSSSKSGAQRMVEAGFGTVYRLFGNYDAWVAAGYQVKK